MYLSIVSLEKSYILDTVLKMYLDTSTYFRHYPALNSSSYQW